MQEYLIKPGENEGFWLKRGDPRMWAEMGNWSVKNGLRQWGGPIVPLSARKLPADFISYSLFHVLISFIFLFLITIN